MTAPPPPQYRYFLLLFTLPEESGSFVHNKINGDVTGLALNISATSLYQGIKICTTS